MADKRLRGFPFIWHGLVSLFGLVGLLLAGWEILFSDGKPELVTVIIVGALLAASPLLLARLDTITFGTRGFELKLTEQIAEQGAPKTARLLDHTELGRLVDAYTVIREELRGDEYEDARVHVQDVLVGRAAGFAEQHEVDPAEVKRLFPKAASVVRVLLIGLMSGDPRLLDAAILISAIQSPATLNEQYQALLLVRRYWGRFAAPERASIIIGIVATDIKDEDSRPVADEIVGLGKGLGTLQPSVKRGLLGRRLL